MKIKVGMIGLLAILAVLLTSGVVFAEGEQPPAAPVECGDCTAEAPAEAAPPPETPPVDESPAAPGETDIAAEPQTEILLVDDAGQALDLASQASADVLLLPDPYFYIKGVKYGYVNIMDAINDIVAMGILPDGGMLYVEDGDYSEMVEIDGTTNVILASMKGMQSEHGSSETTITGAVTLSGLNAGFLLKGFTINGGISITESAGPLLLEDLNVSNPAGTGIEIGTDSSFHQGAATLKDIRVNDNSGHGATIFTTGNISVTNSSFDDNGGNGLRVESPTGTITLKGISASRNDARGIYNVDVGFSKTFTLQHIQVNDNGLYGVDVGKNTATGAFIADTVYAQNNNTSGHTPAISSFKVTTNGAMTLKNILIENTTNGDGLVLIKYSATPIVLQNVVSRFNDETGIDIGTEGNVSLTSVRSTNNGEDGIKVTNYGPGDTGTITITSPASAGNAGANDFSDNGDYGLDLRSNNNITLTNLDASRNGKDGLYAWTTANLTISKNLPNWANSFNNNSMNGIYLRVDGNVSLGYCHAGGNTNSGILFNNQAKAVTVTGGYFDNNGDHGLYINASGNVVLTDISSASYNDWNRSGSFYGIYIDNTANVTIKNTSKTAITAVANNSNRGLSITSTGSVSITGVGAWNNYGDGIYISNREWPGGKPVSLTRIESVFNTGYGVYVYTAGSVSMQDIFMAENTFHGMQIEACVTGGDGCLNLANVTLKGSNNAFSNNGQAGLMINTKGSVSLSHLDVYGNDNGGVKIVNTFNGSSPVTIGGTAASKIDSTLGYGLWVESRGLITVKNLTVQNTSDILTNVHGAVYLSNRGLAKKGVTLVDVEIINNGQTGLYITSDGPVSLQGVSSSYNSISSGWIDEDNSTNGVTERLSGFEENVDQWHFMGESGDSYIITLSSTEFTPMLTLLDEYDSQIDMAEDLDLDGTVTLSFSPTSDGEYVLRVQSSDWGMGVYELTFGGTISDLPSHRGARIDTPASVSIISTKNTFSQFSNNNADGLYLSSGASVTLLNVSADANNYRGIYVEAPNGNTSLSNNHATIFSTFTGNRSDGVSIISGGTITLNNRLIAINNGVHGFSLDNSAASSPKAITIKGVMSIGNTNTGILARSLGALSLSNVEASANNQGGMMLDTDGNVTISGSNVFSANSGIGLHVDTLGTTSISGVLAENNGTNGLYIQSRTGGKTILIKTSVLRFNGDTGLYLNAFGNITLDGVQSLLNTGSGVDLQHNGVQSLIKNSVMMGNTENGLRVETGFYSLVNCLYFGNGSQNIYLY